MVKEHCFECAGHAAAKGESCSTCDGTGKLKKVELKEVSKKKGFFKKVKK